MVSDLKELKDEHQDYVQGFAPKLRCMCFGCQAEPRCMGRWQFTPLVSSHVPCVTQSGILKTCTNGGTIKQRMWAQLGGARSHLPPSTICPVLHRNPQDVRLQAWQHLCL